MSLWCIGDEAVNKIAKDLLTFLRVERYYKQVNEYTEKQGYTSLFVLEKGKRSS